MKGMYTLRFDNRIKRIISALLIFCFVFSTAVFISTGEVEAARPGDIAGNSTSTDATGYSPADAPEINAQAAIVMDIDTGDILYEKDAYSAYYPASITKVLTCLLAVENGNVNDELTISQAVMDQTEKGSSSIGLATGEKLTLRDALYGMMLNSGNECALAIAEHIAGSTEAFANMMNSTAKSLGCVNSNFVNPNGLHDQYHYTCCYDMALIGQKAYQYPEFKTLVGSQTYTIPETNLNEERVLWQENRMLYSGNGIYYYPYCTGGKTGYTLDALATLITFAEQGGKRLVCVVMRCNPTTDSYLDSIKLYDYCFDKYRLCKPLANYEFKEVNEEDSTLLENFYDDLDHTMPTYYVNKDMQFYVRSFVADDDITVEDTFYEEPIDGLAGNIRLLYTDRFLKSADITVTIPVIEATSTDALKEQSEEPETKKTDYVKWLKRACILMLALILILLIAIIVSKIDQWLKEKETKRKVKYFPRNRDHRVIKKQEAQEAKRLKKEQKKQKKQGKKNSDDAGSDDSEYSTVRINEPDGFTESKDLMD